MGAPGTFITALILLLWWAITGPIFGFSDTWQLIINTTTTIIIFSMVFLIQNTQNRDAKAIHLKLDELILAMNGARNTLVNLEELSNQEIEQLKKQFRRFNEHYSKLTDTGEVTEVAEVKNLVKEDHVGNQNR